MRLTLLIALGTLPVMCGAQSLPAALPTGAAAASQAPATAQSHHAQVLFAGGVLTVHAENASLNGLLREVATATGMQITGGVTEDRVYGTYGPADPGTVLAALLAGTGSNMLLEASEADRPLTLVLTPRQGGPTPPSPATFAPDTEDSAEPTAQVSQSGAAANSAATPQNGNVQDAGTPPAQGTSPDTSTSTQPASGGVRTPQQIYDQLMKLKQQQPATPQR